MHTREPLEIVWFIPVELLVILCGEPPPAALPVALGWRLEHFRNLLVPEAHKVWRQMLISSMSTNVLSADCDT